MLTFQHKVGASRHFILFTAIQWNAFQIAGPLPKTTPDFWRMVWEQHCLVIVMTTRVLERGRTKCGQYWETDEGGEWEHGSFRVRTISVESNEEYTVSTLELTNSKVRWGLCRKTEHLKI